MEKLEKSAYMAQNLLSLFFEKKNNENTEQLKTVIDHTLNRMRTVQFFLEKELSDEGSRVYPIFLKTKETINTLEDYKRQLDNPFYLFVMGIGNVGKSTLVNALIEEEIAEMGALPLTWKVDMYIGDKGRNKNCVVHYKTKNHKTMSRMEAVKLVKREEVRLERLEKVVEDKIDNLFDRYEGDFNALEELEKLQKEELKKIQTDISKIEWRVDATDFLSKYTIVDTPGLKQERLGAISHSAKDYYNESEGALWLFDGQKLASKEQRKMIEGDVDVDDHTKLKDVFNDREEKIIGVINRIDNIYNNGGQEQVDKVISEANRLYGHLFKNIVPISAKWALEGIKNSDDELIRKSGIVQLKNEIKRSFWHNASEMKIKGRKIEAINRLEDLRTEYVDVLKHLEKDSNRYIKLDEEVIKAIDNYKEMCKEEMTSLINDYKSEVRKNIDSHINKVLDLEESEKNNFFSNTLFDESYLNREVESFRESSDADLVKLRGELLRETTFKKYKYIDDVANAFTSVHNDNSKIDFKTNTSFDAGTADLWGGIGVGYLAVALLGPIGIVMGVIAGISGLFGEWARNSKIRDIESKCLGELESFCNKLSADLTAIINKNAMELEEIVQMNKEKTFSDLYLDYNKIEEFKETHVEIYRMIKEIEQEAVLDFNINVKDMILEG